MISMVYMVMHAVIWFALSEQRNAQVRLWSLSGLLSGIAVIPLSMRGIVSEFAFIYIGQIAMVLGNAGRCLALRMFFDHVSRRSKLFYGISTLFFLVLMIGGYEAGVSEYYLKIFYFGFYAVILVDYFLLGYWLKDGKRSLGCDLLMGGGLGLMISQAVRAIAIAIDPDSDNIYAQTPDQTLMVIGQFVCIPLTNIGFLRLFLEGREERRLKVERELAASEARRHLLSGHQQELQHLLNEREEIIRQLTLSNKTASMGALVASLAHELNQPLCSIRLNTQLVEKLLLERRQVDSGHVEIDKLIDAMNRENRRAAEIIVKLRKLFEDRSGAMSVVDLSEVVRDCFALVMPYAQTRQVQLRLDKFSECLVDGDQTQLQQVVLNLLNNAIEAASESVADIKRVQVGMQRGQDQVVVSVEDNGNGISEDIQDSVFELFKSTKAEGMGVGLWLSKTVVNAHRGDIQFISKPGEGTRFEVRLPLQSGSPIGLS
jgi:signal transduction histidine kinase